jgi:isocitrate dehydrogenase
MQIIRWTKGGFGMAAHNYDGDMLTDEIAQVHRSPGFITSNLIGINDDGSYIKEFEASHGTVSDLYESHLRGEETSLNPLGLVDALIGAMNHAALLKGGASQGEILNFTTLLRKALENTFRYGQGTKDMAGPTGLSTEKFIDKVAWRLGRYVAATVEDVSPQDLVVPSLKFRRNCKPSPYLICSSLG